MVMGRQRYILAAVAGLWGMLAAGGEAPGQQQELPLNVRLGCTHVAGDYAPHKGDYLNAGADQILKLGMRTIKIYLNDPRGNYRFNSDWGNVSRELVPMAQHPYYRKLFEKPFKTYVMTVFSTVEKDSHYFRKGVSDDQYAREAQQFYELAKYLLTTYQKSDKTFILSHWEGDWAVRGNFEKTPKSDPSEKALAGMVKWLNARQEGVDRAREEVKRTRAKVYHAAEVNLLDLAMEGRPTVTNNVVPHTRCDLYSYSAYDTIGITADDPKRGAEIFRKALAYLAEKAPDSKTFGAKNVYVGEFGWPEVPSEKEPERTTEKQLNVIRMTVEESLAFGCPYVIYWQLYDNECRKSDPKNEDCRGFWLIRPDGSHTAAYMYLESLLKGRR